MRKVELMYVADGPLSRVFQDRDLALAMLTDSAHGDGCLFDLDRFLGYLGQEQHDEQFGVEVSSVARALVAASKAMPTLQGFSFDPVREGGYFGTPFVGAKVGVHVGNGRYLMHEVPMRSLTLDAAAVGGDAAVAIAGSLYSHYLAALAWVEQDGLVAQTPDIPVIHRYDGYARGG